MIYITYWQALLAITLLWCAVRLAVILKNKNVSPKREVQLLLVYVCLAVVVRYTFFPFFRADGVLRPLTIDTARMLDFRLNLLPIVHLLDHPSTERVLINVIGNVAMFVPLGAVWPTVFPPLRTFGRALAAGVGCSLVIELLQLPIYERFSDVDDVILNTVGFAIGYGAYRLIGWIRIKRKTAKGKIG